MYEGDIKEGKKSGYGKNMVIKKGQNMKENFWKEKEMEKENYIVKVLYMKEILLKEKWMELL